MYYAGYSAAKCSEMFVMSLGDPAGEALSYRTLSAMSGQRTVSALASWLEAYTGEGG